MKTTIKDNEQNVTIICQTLQCKVYQKITLSVHQDEGLVKQNNHSKIDLHNQRGWWDCYGSACQPVYQTVSHSLWLIA